MARAPSLAVEERVLVAEAEATPSQRTPGLCTAQS